MRIKDKLRGYRHTFEDYEKFIDNLYDDGCKFEKMVNRTNHIALIHDIDHDINKAVRLAEIEYNNGVQSTYYVITTRFYPFWRKTYDYRKEIEKIKYIQSLGHEIGFHNDLLTLDAKKGISAKDELRKVLDFFYDNGINIFSSHAHGSRWCRKNNQNNSSLWNYYWFRTHFIYNADEMIRYARGYYSDCRNWKPKYGIDTQNAIILTHPCWFGDRSE